MKPRVKISYGGKIVYPKQGKHFKLTIPYTKVAGDLTDFPVFVNPQDIDTLTLAQAQGIRIYDSNNNEIPREIVSKDEMWFKAPSLSSSTDTDFYIELTDNPDYAPSDDYGRESVWNDTVATYLFTGGNANDHSPNGNNGTPSNVTRGAEGLILAGSRNSYVNLGNKFNADNGGMTVSARFKINNFSNKTPPLSVVIGKGDFFASSCNNGGRSIRYDTSTIIASFGSTGDYNNHPNIAYAPSTKAWYDVKITLYSSKRQAFINGTKEGEETISGIATNSFDCRIGQKVYNTNDSRMDGTVSNIRIYNKVLSSDRIATEHNNQSDPSTFYTIS